MPKQRLRFLIVGSNWQGHNRTPHVLAFLTGFHPQRTAAVRVALDDCLPWERFTARKLMRLPLHLLFAVVDAIQALAADAIYVLPMNPWALTYARVLSAIGRAKLVVDYYAPSTTTLEDRGEDRCWAGNESQCRSQDRLVLRAAHVVVVPHRSEVDVVAEIVGLPVPASRLAVVPLCCEDRGSHFSWTPGRPLRVAWWGKFSTLHGADLVLEAMAALGELRKQVSLTIIGLPEERNVTAREIERLKLSDCVTFRCDLTFHDSTLPSYLASECDLALGHFGTSRKALSVLSNKIVEALSLGIPVLTGRGPGVREFLSESEVLMVDQRPASIAQALTRVANGEIDLTRLAQAGKNAFVRHFSTDSFRTSFGALVWDRLVERGNVG